MQPDIISVWNACRVRRWHTNPHLSETNDLIDGHSHRVLMIALALEPELSRDAIIAISTHDMGEHGVGDFSYMVKKARPDLAAELDDMEKAARQQIGLPTPTLTPREASILKIADWLDAWLWMLRHSPDLNNREDWRDQCASFLDLAEEAGLSEPVQRVVWLAEHRLSEGVPV